MRWKAFALTALLIGCTTKPATDVPARDDDRWLLQQARESMFKVGIEHSGDDTVGLTGAVALSPTDPQVRELEPLLDAVARAAPKGIVAGDRPNPEQWRYAWLDIDGDGRREILLTGGTGPAPFYALLKQGRGDAPTSWRILHQAPFRFLGVSLRAGTIYLFGGFDGYGVLNPSLVVDRIENNSAATSPTKRLVFDLLGWDSNAQIAKTSVRACSTTKQTTLRTGPERDDQPVETGLGDDLPGNLFQTLAAGSTGWKLAAARDPEGPGWSLCCFVGTSPLDAEEPGKEMLVPKRLIRKPLVSVTTLLVGWVPSDDLAER